MIKIKNKLQSEAFIKEKGLNTLQYFKVNSVTQALSCLYDSKLVPEPICIRHIGLGGNPFKKDLTFEGACFYVKAWHFQTPLAIYPYQPIDDKDTVNCEIKINKDYTFDAHYMQGNLKMRDALAHPKSKHVVKGDLRYRPLRWAIRYCLDNDLIGCIVELTLASKPVGIKKEHIICWEVRNY